MTGLRPGLLSRSSPRCAPRLSLRGPGVTRRRRAAARGRAGGVRVAEPLEPGRAAQSTRDVDGGERLRRARRGFKRPARVSMRPGEFERVVAAPADRAEVGARPPRLGPAPRPLHERVADLATTAPRLRPASRRAPRSGSCAASPPTASERRRRAQIWPTHKRARRPARAARVSTTSSSPSATTVVVALAPAAASSSAMPLPPPPSTTAAAARGSGGADADACRAVLRGDGAQRLRRAGRRARDPRRRRRVDATLGELRERGVDVDALLAAFAEHLHAAMTSGARHVAKALGRPTSPATGADTLIMSLCFRRCAIAALDRAVVLEYPGPEAPRAGRGRGWLRRGAD